MSKPFPFLSLIQLELHSPTKTKLSSDGTWKESYGPDCIFKIMKMRIRPIT
jgi:hypothetical protein